MAPEEMNTQLYEKLAAEQARREVERLQREVQRLRESRP